MYFNPHYIEALIIEPLRYFFGTYTTPSKFYWNKDEKKRTVDIYSKNDVHTITDNERPRILVDRGSYQITKTGLTDNMAEGSALSSTYGINQRINMVFYTGTASMIVEARQKGSCEIIADMATHCLLWSRPFICKSQGFKEFGMPMSVGECELVAGEEDGVEKFRVQVQLPYMREEQWKVNNDAIHLKNIIQNLTPG